MIETCHHTLVAHCFCRLHLSTTFHFMHHYNLAASLYSIAQYTIFWAHVHRPFTPSHTAPYLSNLMTQPTTPSLFTTLSTTRIRLLYWSYIPHLTAALYHFQPSTCCRSTVSPALSSHTRFSHHPPSLHRIHHMSLPLWQNTMISHLVPLFISPSSPCLPASTLLSWTVIAFCSSICVSANEHTIGDR